MSRGILYIASGDKYIEEAKQSAASVKAVMPSMAITLIVDQPVESPLFDQIRQRPLKSGFMGRVANMLATPYERTLFLDTDTYICADFSELFHLLDKFELAGTHAPRRFSIKNYLFNKPIIDGVPIAFPELNGGMLLFRKCQAVEACLRAWETEHRRDLAAGIKNDQPGLRRVLYNSNIRLFILPPEYNCRFVFPVGISRNVKILHGRHPNIAKIAQKINRSPEIRIFSLETGLFIHPRERRRGKRMHPLKLLLWRLTGRQML